MFKIKDFFCKKDFKAIFLDTNYRNLVQFKHACLEDYDYRDEVFSLSNCSCGYHKKFRLPCWHMYQVAIKKGIFSDCFERGQFLLPMINTLPDDAFGRLGQILYEGFYETEHPLSSLGIYKDVISKSGLIIVNGKTFTYIKEIQENIFFVLYTFFSDKRCKSYFKLQV